LRFQLAAEIVNGAKAINALAMAGNKMSLKVSSTQLHLHSLHITDESQAQIQFTLPALFAGLQLLLSIAMQVVRRGHMPEHRIDYHKFSSSFFILTILKQNQCHTIKPKLFRERKCRLETSLFH
jgi:hypothetical protein